MLASMIQRGRTDAGAFRTAVWSAIAALAVSGALAAEPAAGSPETGVAPTRKELEKQIKDAESRARKLDREARDDERRANSWTRRAEDAERIKRMEDAARNRKIAEGFAQDAAKRRKEAQDLRTQAADWRQMLADLRAGRPIAGPSPGGAPPPPPKAVTGEPDVPGLDEPAPDKPATPGTGQTGAAPPPPPPAPPGESVGRPISPGEQLACVLPYIVIFRLAVLDDMFGHHGPIGLPERLVLAFALTAATQYSILPQEVRTAMLLFAAGATGILTPAECAFIALGTGQAAGLLGVKWRLEMTAESPWRGKLTVGLDRTLPNGPIVYSLEEIGRQETRR